LSFCWEGTRRPTPNWRGESSRTDIPPAIIVIRILCLAVCRPQRRRPKLTEASLRMSSRFTADDARRPLPPFSRSPGSAMIGFLLDQMSDRAFVVFGPDVWASDWLHMGPEQELRLILSRVEKLVRGIVLFHDTKIQTAKMMPAFLRELKRRGF